MRDFIAAGAAVVIAIILLFGGQEILRLRRKNKARLKPYHHDQKAREQMLRDSQNED